MSKTKKLLLAVVMLFAAAVLIYSFFSVSRPEDPQLEALRQSIVAEPEISGNVVGDARAELLDRFASVKGRLEAGGFENLQDLEEVAQVKKTAGDFLGAADAWQYMGLLRPKNPWPFLNLGRLYHYELKRYDLAEKNYLLALANGPSEIQAVRNLFELYFYALGDRAKAEALLLTSIERTPELADLYALAGSFYSKAGQKEKALEFYEKHLRLNPNNGVILGEILRLKLELGQ